MENRMVTTATGDLEVMRSVERGPNPQVQIGQLIPNFPGTPDDITQMTGILPF